ARRLLRAKTHRASVRIASGRESSVSDTNQRASRPTPTRTPSVRNRRQQRHRVKVLNLYGHRQTTSSLFAASTYRGARRDDPRRTSDNCDGGERKMYVGRL